MDAQTIKELDVFDLLNRLNEMKPRLLKELATLITSPLGVYFNLPVTQGRLPKDWKNIIVCPILKTCMRHKNENYWPVSPVSVVVKIIKKIIRKRLFKYLDENRVLSKKQHGFIIGFSCLTNLLAARKSGCSFKEQKLPINVAYIHFSKAFDKVPHNQVLYRLSNIGMGGSLLMWIKDFPVGRQQKIRVN